MKKFKPCFSHWAAIICGGIILVVGAIIIPLFNAILPKVLGKTLTLKDHTKGLTSWEHPMETSDAYLTFYVYDLMNPDAVLNGSKPIVKEMGPYVYYASKVRTDVKFEPNGTVYFKGPRTMVFDESRSSGSENDTFTTINVPLYTIMNMLKNEPTFALLFEIAIRFVKGTTLFKEFTVHEILWGYQDALLKDLADILSHIPIKLPVKTDGHFGFFYKKNNTDTGLFNVNTGENGMDTFMFINSWNKETHLPYWNTEVCNRINGTDGQVYHPFVDLDEKMYMFVADLCRSIYLKYTKSVMLKGITLSRFKPPRELWTYEDNPENQCFCVGDVCPHAGVLNISACQGNAPVFVSLPHFLYGDYYKNLVGGMHPDIALHDTYIDVEKTSGIVMEGSKRIQLNVAIERIKHFGETKHLLELLFPVIWLDQSANINDKGIAQFKRQLLYLQIAIPIVAYCMIAIGALFFVIGLTVFLVRKRRAYIIKRSGPGSKVVNERSPLLSEDTASGSSAASEDDHTKA